MEIIVKIGIMLFFLLVAGFFFNVSLVLLDIKYITIKHIVAFLFIISSYESVNIIRETLFEK